MAREQTLIRKTVNNAYAIETFQYKFILNKVGPKGMYISVWGKEAKKAFSFYTMASIAYILDNYWNSEKAIKRLFTDLVLETPHRMNKINAQFF